MSNFGLVTNKNIGKTETKDKLKTKDLPMWPPTRPFATFTKASISLQPTPKVEAQSMGLNIAWTTKMCHESVSNFQHVSTGRPKSISQFFSQLAFGRKRMRFNSKQCSAKKIRAVSSAPDPLWRTVLLIFLSPRPKPKLFRGCVFCWGGRVGLAPFCLQFGGGRRALRFQMMWISR